MVSMLPCKSEQSQVGNSIDAPIRQVIESKCRPWLGKLAAKHRAS